MNQNILDFGAVSNGIYLNTTSIQSAIDKCAETGGGRVTVPSGIFKSGTLWLRSNVELYLEAGAEILASDNMDDYNDMDAYEQNSRISVAEGWVGKHLIIAYEIENCAITGFGKINGNCHAFVDPCFDNCELAKWGWKQGVSVLKDKEKMRPGQLICFVESQNIRVHDVSVADSPCWSIFVHGCEFVQIRGVKVNNPAWMLNSDGIDIDASRYVTVSDCIILTGDDAITLRACEQRLKNKEMHCEYVTITNCVLSSSICAFRIGVGKGSIKHARISNIVVKSSHILAQICTTFSQNCKADVEDVNFSNISADNTAIFLGAFAQNGAYIKNITMENIRSECEQENSILVQNGSIENITLRNIELIYPTSENIPADDENTRRVNSPIYASNVSRMTLDNVKVTGIQNVTDEDIIKNTCPEFSKNNCNF